MAPLRTLIASGELDAGVILQKVDEEVCDGLPEPDRLATRRGVKKGRIE
jgi:hypothetical protein